jgi:hypothetical protein
VIVIDDVKASEEGQASLSEAEISNSGMYDRPTKVVRYQTILTPY